MGSCFKYSSGRVSQPGAGVALGCGSNPRVQSATKPQSSIAGPGKDGEVEEGTGGRPRASHISNDTDPLVASDSSLIDSLQTSQPRQAMAQTPREGRPARHAEATIGWPSDVWRLARPAATGDLSHECIVAGRCLTAEGPSGNFTVMAEPKRCSDQSHVGMVRRGGVA